MPEMGKMAQWSRAWTVLAEDLSLIPSTYIRWLTQLQGIGHSYSLLLYRHMLLHTYINNSNNTFKTVGTLFLSQRLP